MRKKTNNNISSILSSLALVMLAVVVVGFLFSATNNFSEKITTFYVKQNSITIKNDYDNFEIVQNQKYVFDVFDPAQTIKGEKVHFTARVYYNYNEDTAFDYMVDENTYCSSYLEDVTQGFEIEIDNEFFTFEANNDMQQILELYHPSQVVSNCPSVIDTDISYFTLRITGTDSGKEININLIIKSE